MGTRLRAEVTAAPALAQAALEAAWLALASTEERLSTWETFGPATGVLARANAAPAATWVDCDAQTARELTRVRTWSDATDGALAETCGAWIELYDLRGAGRWPSDVELRRLLDAPAFAWELADGRLRRLTDDTRFEEGAFGKGAGLDLALARLREAGVADACIDLGGQFALLGAPRWIELADPDDRQRSVARVRVANGSLSTTGNSERGRDLAGRRLGHVLDPRSGLPADDWGAIAVRAASALDADCLSTALFVLGPDAALAFAAARPDIDVVCLERSDAGVRIRASAGLATDLQLIAPEGRIIAPMMSFLASASIPILTGLVAHAQQAAPQQASAPQEPVRSVESRIAALESENAELKRRMDAVGGELEKFSFRQVLGELGPTAYGLGPAASKVYGIGQGVSIGGYGEMLYENYAGDSKNDQLDLLRAVLYFGYKFDERWVLNTEIEFEHATTSDGPDAGTAADGEVSVEFAYLDYLIDDAFNLRAGLLLLPLGHVNELHEPTVFLGARRPVSETVILPTTWRENGIGAHGDLGDFSYRAYLVNGFDAEGFSASGLRGGRQKGAKALAEDFALAARLDWHATTGVDVGIGAYHGDAGQDLELAGDGIDATTTLVEAHASARWRGWRARGLIVRGEVDDVADLNAALAKVGSASIGEELEGQYVELGYDVMPHLSDDSTQSLTPYVRWEEVDTQAKVPNGFAANPANDQELWTFGVQWQPIDNVVVKLDYIDFENGDDSAVDQWNVLIGYVF
jgi:thiamine biosynthesis lipoprotein ApbE